MLRYSMGVHGSRTPAGARRRLTGAWRSLNRQGAAPTCRYATRSAWNNLAMPMKTPPEHATEDILRHWREAVPNDRLAHLVKDATRALVRALQMRLMEHGVSFGHWTFLRILWEHDGLTQRELSGQAGVMEPTTFSALKALEKLGYIERRQLPDNRKNVYVHLTPRGRALRDVLVPLA